MEQELMIPAIKAFQKIVSNINKSPYEVKNRGRKAPSNHFLVYILYLGLAEKVRKQTRENN
jgi:hypothetical protein